MKRRTKVNLIGLCFIVLMIVFGFVSMGNIWARYVFGAILIAAIVVHRILWRCPHCGRYLRRQFGDHCQYCGESIDD